MKNLATMMGMGFHARKNLDEKKAAKSKKDNGAFAKTDGETDHNTR